MIYWQRELGRKRGGKQVRGWKQAEMWPQLSGLQPQASGSLWLRSCTTALTHLEAGAHLLWPSVHQSRATEPPPGREGVPTGRGQLFGERGSCGVAGDGAAGHKEDGGRAPTAPHCMSMNRTEISNASPRCLPVGSEKPHSSANSVDTICHHVRVRRESGIKEKT